jgi:hypothetical protein
MFSQDLGVPRRDLAPSFTFERANDDGRAAPPGASVDHVVNELDELIGKAQDDLLGHSKMVRETPPRNRGRPQFLAGPQKEQNTP